MIRRAMAMLVVVAVALVTAVATGHAVRMDGYAGHATHTSQIITTEASSGPACGDEQSCGPASAALCAFVCVGGLSFIFPDQGTATFEQRSISFKRPDMTAVRGHDQGRNDRPPISYLL